MFKYFLLILLLTNNLFAGFYFEKSEVSPVETPFHEHKLRFSNQDNGWVCNNKNCRRNIKFEYQSYEIPRLRCRECDFDLCDLCAQIKTHSYQHPWHNHELFRNYVDNGWICEGRLQKDGCKSYVVDYNQTGKMKRYRCEVCDYDLCEECMKAGIKSFRDLDGKDLHVDFQSGSDGDLEILSLGKCETNYENIDHHEIVKFFDKSVSLEPLKDPNSNFNEEETKKEDKMDEEKTYNLSLDTNECIICCERPKNVCLVHGNDGHIVCCETCSLKLTECPICRKPIDMVVKHVNVK